MASKVRVYGKAQNRTALGIINAYKVMFPHATFEDFEKAFPKELNPDSGWPVNFKKLEDCKTDNEKGFWFIDKDEVVKLQDGTNLVLVKMWTKPSFERLVNHAKQYDIEVAEFEKGVKGQKGGFRLEYLNGYVPPVPVKKGIPWWIWAIIGAIVAIIIALLILLGNRNSEPQVVEVEKVVEVHDTVYMAQLEEIEKNYNAAQFEQGKTDLNDDAKYILHDLSNLMKKNPTLKLRIVGHTSADGDATTNQKLSEARAKAAVDLLISKGVEESRLEYKGMGSTQLKDPENPNSEVNRRTEFEVIE